MLVVGLWCVGVLTFVRPLIPQVRHVATAGDTAFGVTRYCEHAIWDDLPKIAFCTQEYNLFTQNKVEFGESSPRVAARHQSVLCAAWIVVPLVVSLDDHITRCNMSSFSCFWQTWWRLARRGKRTWRSSPRRHSGGGSSAASICSSAMNGTG